MSQAYPPPRSTASSNSAVSPNANCSRRPRTRSSKPSRATRSGRPTCCLVPTSNAPAAAKCRPSCMPFWMTPAASFPHAQFYPNQGLDACLDCLRQAIAARGVPVRMYIDNAKIYRSPQLARIAASLGILIVHTPPYQPEGRGKIERFFRSSVVDNRRPVMCSSQLCGPEFEMGWILLVPMGSAQHKLTGIVGLQFKLHHRGQQCSINFSLAPKRGSDMSPARFRRSDWSICRIAPTRDTRRRLCAR